MLRDSNRLVYVPAFLKSSYSSSFIYKNSIYDYLLSATVKAETPGATFLSCLKKHVMVFLIVLVGSLAPVVSSVALGPSW